jgi:hypothetical protein
MSGLVDISGEEYVLTNFAGTQTGEPHRLGKLAEEGRA